MTVTTTPTIRPDSPAAPETEPINLYRFSVLFVIRRRSLSPPSRPAMHRVVTIGNLYGEAVSMTLGTCHFDRPRLVPLAAELRQDRVWPGT